MKNDQNIEQIQSLNYYYTINSFCLIEAEARGKKPVGFWKDKLGQPLLSIIANTSANVAAKMGDASGGKVDIDIDAIDALDIAAKLLPATGCIFGHKSKPRSHYIYSVTLPGATERFQDPDFNAHSETASVIEYRANDAVTIVPPSTHKSGECIEFAEMDSPSEVDSDFLLAIVKRIYAATLIRRRWKEGMRHDAALALSGALARSGWNKSDVKDFLEIVIESAGDSDLIDRLKCCDDTFARLNRGERLTGWPTLGRLFGPVVANKICKALSISDQHDALFLAAPEPGSGGVFDFSESTVGQEMAEALKGSIVFVKEDKCWYGWNGKYWEPNAVDLVERLTQQHLQGFVANRGISVTKDNEARRAAKRLLDSSGVRGVIQAAQPWLNKSIESFDKHPDFLNCRNGLLNLKTGVLQPHDSKLFISKYADVDFDENAECPIFDRFLAEIFNGDEDATNFVLRALGYTLSGSAAEQSFFVCHGSGGNGKSTLINLCAEILGTYAATIPIQALLKQRDNSVRAQPELARLRGVRLARTSETEKEEALAEALVKQMTGGENLAVRPLYKDTFEFKPQFKIWMTTNYRLRLTPTDEAIWRRLQFIPFDFKASARDISLEDKLRRESSGILNRLVTGCLEWQEVKLNAPSVIETAKRNYRYELDSVQAFIDAEIVSEQGSIASNPIMRYAYTNFCRESGFDPVGEGELTRQLRLKGFSHLPGKSMGRRWANVKLSDMPELQF